MEDQIQEFKDKLARQFRGAQDQVIQEAEEGFALVVQNLQKQHTKDLKNLQKFGLPDQNSVHYLKNGRLVCRAEVEGEGGIFLAINCSSTTKFEYVTCPECLTKIRG